MNHRRIVKSKDNAYSVQIVEYPLLHTDGEFLGSEDQNTENLSLEDMLELHPNLSSLIEKSKDKAEAIIQNAHTKAAVIEERSKRSGYDAGYKAGYENATEEIRQAIESVSSTFKQAIDDLASLKRSILSQSEGDIVRLAMEIARKLVCKELKQHPDTIIAIVKKASELAQNKSEITIKVHPDDYGILKQHAGQLISQLSEINSEFDTKSPLRIEEDPELSPGGCIVATDTSLIDMSLETRLESLDYLLTPDAQNPECMNNEVQKE